MKGKLKIIVIAGYFERGFSKSTNNSHKSLRKLFLVGDGLFVLLLIDSDYLHPIKLLPRPLRKVDYQHFWL